MKGLLLSAGWQLGKPILKFYEPKSNTNIIWTGEYTPYMYVTQAVAGQIKEMMGIQSMEDVDIFDSIQDAPRKMVKVSFNNPMGYKAVKEGYPCYEGDIKWHQSYLYDNRFIVGKWYDISAEDVTPVSDKSEIDVKVDMGGVIDISRFKDSVNDWAQLLGEPIPEIRRLAFDIEVEATDIMPDPLVAPQRVTAISFASTDGVNMVYILDRDQVPVGEPATGYEYKVYKSEKEMLEDAFKIIASYPVVLTYNGDKFDMPYLYTRAINLGITNTPFRMMKQNATLDMGIHVDMYGVFSNRSLKLYAFKNLYADDGLGSVSSALLKETKLEFEGNISEIPLHTLGHYCYNDSRLTLKLSTYDNNTVMKLLVILCRVGNMPIDDISRVSISNWIKSLLYFTHRKAGQLIPTSADFEAVEASTASSTGKKYKGANVLEPIAGIHFTVTALDFASLYPSIIKTRNVSYDTIRCKHDECKSNLIPETNHWSCTKKTGIVSLLIGSLKELRVGHFKKLSKSSASAEEKQQYEAISESLKVFLNASYGVIGYKDFPLYYLPVAEAVTAAGRNIITSTIQEAKNQGMEVIMSDTDSCYVKNPKPEQVKYMIDWTKEQYKIDLEVDKQYRYIVLSDRKKNYFGIKTDGKVDIKGLTGKKSSTPIFIKHTFNAVLDELKKVMVPEDFPMAKNNIINIVRQVVTRFDTIPLEDIAFNMKISREANEYKSNTQAMKAIALLGRAVKKGEIVRYIKTWTAPKAKPIQLVRRDEVDKEKYIESLSSVLEQVIDPMDLDMDSILTGTKQATLF